MLFSKAITAILILVGSGLVHASESDPDPLAVCEPNPCGDNGRCLPAHYTELGYECRCSIGFYGAQCTETNDAFTLTLIGMEALEDPSMTAGEMTSFEESMLMTDSVCEGNPCENDGKCLADDTADVGYVCYCTTGWTGQNCEEKEDHLNRFLRGDTTEASEDHKDVRNLQGTETVWACRKNGYAVASVRIWWGHTSGDATWACNNWNSAICGGACQASSKQITRSNWYCYSLDPKLYIGSVNIWWGHAVGDAAWACNAWNSRCSQYGGCYAQNVNYSDGQNPPYNTFIKCSGNGGACTAFSGGGQTLTLNRFDADGTDEKVWGCGGSFQLSGATVSTELSKEPTLGLSLSFSQSASFYGWEGCCAVAGEALQSRGYLSDGWYCEKDAFSTGIWLKGKAHWL